MTLAEVDIKCAAFDPAGKTLAIGLESGEVKLCSWPALEVTKSLGKHGDSVTGIAFSPDGKFILTTSSEPANKPDKAGRGDGAVHSDHNYIVYRYTKPPGRLIHTTFYAPRRLLFGLFDRSPPIKKSSTS